MKTIEQKLEEIRLKHLEGFGKFGNEDEDLLVVAIEEGRVSDIYSLITNKEPKHIIIDYDRIESGYCPLCGNKLEEGYQNSNNIICLNCDVDWVEY